MTPEDFVASRQAAWGELRALIQQAGTGRQLKRLGGERVRRMADLYRETAADLAFARLRYPNLVPDLADLTGEAHAILYTPSQPKARRILMFLITGFPRLLRREWRYVAIGVFLLMAPAIAAYLWALIQPDKGQVFLPEVWRQLAQSGPTGGGIDPGVGAITEGTYAFTQIFFNNVRVGFLTFAGGMLFGVGAAYILISNGLLFGALAGLVTHYGFALRFWGLILPHGFLELSCIAIAGAAGAMIGWSLIDPGADTRGRAVVAAAGKAVRMIIGVTVFLFFAALLESYVTPSSALDDWTKIAIGLIVGVAFWSYVAFAGREAATDEASEIAARPADAIAHDLIRASASP